MTNKQHNKKGNNTEQGINQFNETKVDEIILQVEKNAQEEKKRSTKDTGLDETIDSLKKNGDKITLALIFILLLLSIVQSVELFNLRGQIVKGQFTSDSGASSLPPQGGSQGLPAQQGGC